MITTIRTDLFNISMMGRSGSRSFIDDLVRESTYAYYTDTKKFGKKIKHEPFLNSFANFNNKQILSRQKLNKMKIFPNVLVLRDPKERAIAGSNLRLNMEWHGYPFLHKIDFEIVTNIIKFEDIGNYVDTHIGLGENIKNNLQKTKEEILEEHERELKFFREENYSHDPLANHLKTNVLREIWNISDIPEKLMENEYKLYEKFLSKPIFDPEDYKSCKRQINYINCKGVSGTRYKTWDS